MRKWLLLLALGVLPGLLPTEAAARTLLHPCGDRGRLQCGRVAVALDPSGHVRGRVKIALERYSQTSRPAGTIVAFAGGPGQSAIGVLPLFRAAFAPLLATDALVVFDERGIGRSEPLLCPFNPHGTSIASCAHRLGRRAAFYSSDETVADLEAVRSALRLRKFDLYGASYGTYQAMQYAQRYPQHVLHLILDSSLPSDGDQDIKLNSIASLRRQLATICPTACPGIDPASDFQALLAALPREADPGIRESLMTRVEAQRDLYISLFDSDLDPLVRATVPMALHLGAAGEISALDRLTDLAVASQARERRSIPTIVRGGPRGRLAINLEPLATRCEDERFVWRKSDRLAAREAKLRAEESAIPPAATAPIGIKAAASESGVEQCVRWPWSGSRPQREPASTKHVPTLILSGTDDVRTPLEQAMTLQQGTPDSVLLTVPNVGHAVLASDHSGCAQRAVIAFLDDATVSPCAATPAPSVDPLPPASLAAVTPALSTGGEPGQVLTAVVLTLRHDIGLPGIYHQQLAFAGTASGYTFPTPSGKALHSLSYIPGVTLSGRILTARRRSRFGTGRVTVDLAAKPYGTIVLSSDGSLRGTLGGVAVSLTPEQRASIDEASGLQFLSML